MQFTQQGLYDRATALLNSIEPNIFRILKCYQFITSYSGLVKLKVALRRYDSMEDRYQHAPTHLTPHRMDTLAASHLLRQLKAGALPDPELTFQISLLEIDYLTRIGSLPAAFTKLEDLGLRLKEDGADVYQRMHLLVQKANLFARCGVPQKGFSVALRAASLAHGARVLPALWEAMAAVCGILVSLEEHEATRRILDAVIPQVRAEFLFGPITFGQFYVSEDIPIVFGLALSLEAGLGSVVSMSRLTLARLSKAET